MLMQDFHDRHAVVRDCRTGGVAPLRHQVAMERYVLCQKERRQAEAGADRPAPWLRLAMLTASALRTHVKRVPLAVARFARPGSRA